MTPKHIESNQRYLDLTQVYNDGHFEITIEDEKFDFFPDKVKVKTKIQPIKSSELIMQVDLKTGELIREKILEKKQVLISNNLDDINSVPEFDNLDHKRIVLNSMPYL